MVMIRERLFIGSNGLYAAEAIELRRLVNSMLREARKHLKHLVTG